MKIKFYFSCALMVLALAWGAPLLPTAVTGAGWQAAAGTVTGFTLVNAVTDKDLFELTPGMVVDLSLLPTQKLNIRADVSTDTDTDPIGSVVFTLTRDGTPVPTFTQNAAPYAVFSDFQGDYYEWMPDLGNYTLTAVPYSEPDGKGDDGAPLTLNFTFINSVGAVASYTLVNAETDQDIMTLSSGAVLDLATLPTKKLNIRANVNPAVVGSVFFDLGGTETRFSVENVAPYALFSDLLGDYEPWTPAPGAYTLKATPYALAGQTGRVGATLAINFTVADSPLPVQLVAFTAEAPNPGTVQLRWNTASELRNARFEVQRSTDGRLFTVLGGLAGHGTTNEPQTYAYQDKQLPASVSTLYYRLRQVDTNGAFAYSPVRAVAVAPGAPAALQTYLATVPDGQLHYAYTGTTTGTEVLEMYSLMGQRLGRFSLAASGQGTVPVAGLAPGAYVLHLVSAQGRLAGRFVLP